MPRPSNTAVRRRQIAESLISVMAKHGYDGASVGEIAKHARLAPGIVHYHFKNKLEILIESVRALAAEHLRLLDEAVAKKDEPPGQLVAYIDVHLGLGAHANAEALACWVLITAEALREKRVRVEVEKVLGELTTRAAAIIRAGREAKQFACADPDAAAAALVATIQGYYVVAATARALIPRGTAAKATLAMVEGLVEPAKPLPARRR